MMEESHPRTSEAVQSEAESALYRQMVQNAGVAMVSSDDALHIRTWNNAAAAMFGASAESMVGASIVSVIPNEGREQGRQLIARTLDVGTSDSFEFDHHDAQGQPCTLLVIVSPIIDDDGRRTGVLACFRDVTVRVRMAAELAQQGKMASLGRMAGALAHHYNNTLGGAVTSIDFALATDSPTLQARSLRQTSEALARTTRITDCLLAFAEGDTRHLDECDLTELIFSVTDYMEPEMAAQGVEMTLSLEADRVTRVPRAQLVTVLENVLHNAVDAMPNGGTVTISTYFDDDDVVLAIDDTGCGMDASHLTHVFEPFFTTKASESLDFEGHPGLGLTVVHGILKTLGLPILVESNVGRSTTVTIRFRATPDSDS